MLKIDKIFALSLVVSNTYILYLSKFRQPHMTLILILLIVAFYYFFRRGDREEWHVASAAITTLCVLAYIS